VEREILLTGIGGQGIQLASKTLATAAIREGLEVMVLGTYGGTMRGGNTDSSMVLGTGPLLSPPVIDQAWAALVMHHHGWPQVRDRLRPGSVVVIDSSVFRGELGQHSARVLEVRATALATEQGKPQAASMIALGAFVAATGLVELASLLEAATEVLPPYRAQHARANAEAMRFGYESVSAPLTRAWAGREEAVS
jgi:Pyruvate/2-oxoacid:ferredoxin oxidoreductase gamma subunit